MQTHPLSPGNDKQSHLKGDRLVALVFVHKKAAIVMGVGIQEIHRWTRIFDMQRARGGNRGPASKVTSQFAQGHRVSSAATWRPDPNVMTQFLFISP